MYSLMMQIGLPAVAFTIIAFILWVALAAMVFQIVSRAKAKTFEHDLQRQIEGAKREAENIIKSAQIEAAAESDPIYGGTGGNGKKRKTRKQYGQIENNLKAKYQSAKSPAARKKILAKLRAVRKRKNSLYGGKS